MIVALNSYGVPTSAIERSTPDHDLDISPSWRHVAGCELFLAAAQQLCMRVFGADLGL